MVHRVFKHIIVTYLSDTVCMEQSIIFSKLEVLQTSSLPLYLFHWTTWIFMSVDFSFSPVNNNMLNITGRSVATKFFIILIYGHRAMVQSYVIWVWLEHSTKAIPILHDPGGKHWKFFFLQILKLDIHFWYFFYGAISQKQASSNICFIALCPLNPLIYMSVYSSVLPENNHRKI